MNSKYYLTEEIKPQVNKMGNVAFTSDDVIFDWTAFEIPKGTAVIKSFSIKVAGTNGSSQTQNFDLFFARSIDGVAPPTLGDSNDAKNLIKTTAAKPYIIGYHGVDASETEDLADSLVGYNVYGNGKGNTADISYPQQNPIFLEGEHDFPGDSNYSKTTPGYQTLWVACTGGAFDFGTGVNIAGDNAADHLTIDVDGTDADDIFAVGDTVIAFDADGSGETTIGKVTALTDAVVTVDAAPSLIADDDELCNLNPITFRFGIEY